MASHTISRVMPWVWDDISRLTLHYIYFLYIPDEQPRVEKQFAGATGFQMYLCNLFGLSSNYFTFPLCYKWIKQTLMILNWQSIVGVCTFPGQLIRIYREPLTLVKRTVWPTWEISAITDFKHCSLSNNLRRRLCSILCMGPLALWSTLRRCNVFSSILFRLLHQTQSSVWIVGVDES